MLWYSSPPAYLSTKVWHFWNLIVLKNPPGQQNEHSIVLVYNNIKSQEAYLIRKHGINGFLFEDPRSSTWMDTVVQQHCNDLAVIGRACETTRTPGVEGGVDLFLGGREEGTPVEVAVRVERQSAVGSAGVHVGQIRLHRVRGEHVDVLEAHGLEDVLLEIVVEFQAADPFDELTGPVDVDAVLPHLTRLVHERLGEVVVVRP